MRLTIERMRLLVLTAGFLLLAALLSFWVARRWKEAVNLKELPRRLGVNIQQDASGFTYTQAHGDKTLFKIHASKVVQLKQGNALLHDVRIELYGEDGSRVDRIEGKEFEYDQKAGKATATGPVEITLMRPGVAPAIAPKAMPGQTAGGKASPLTAAAETAARGEIQVKTSALIFDQKSEIATTNQRVDFSMAQGGGSSMGATYDSQNGFLVLDRAVELTTERAGATVRIHARHGEFERDTQVCRLHTATAEYKDGQASAGDATVLFREDGTAQRLDAVNGFSLATASGARIAAPTGRMDFDEKNRPRHGHLEGGVAMDSTRESAGLRRQTHESSPTAELEFTAQGELRHAHLERGVEMRSEELSESDGAAKAGGPLRVSRTWRSPVADIEFRNAEKGQVEPSAIHGTGGVIVTGESQRGNGAIAPSRLAADEVNGTFGPESQLTAMTGTGHAAIEETSTTGARQTATGDRLEAHFAPPPSNGTKPGDGNGAAQVESAALDGHVTMTQTPAAKPDAPAEAPLRATAGRAVYDGAGEWLHLTVNPRVEDGGLELTAEKVDVSRATGDAFAHGNVKASWTQTAAGKAAPQPASQQPASAALGGQGQAHAVSAEAQLHQATGEVTFRGQARMWRQGNSVAAPAIMLDRQRQTLVARSADAAEPVRAVLLSASGADSSRAPRSEAGKSTSPSVIRLRGGYLKYSDAERKATMRGGELGTVVAETAAATSISNEAELLLLPPGNRAGKDGEAAQVDRLTARGRVTVTSQGRRGTGEQLVYSSETGEYVLTGTASAPPRMTDPERGTTTGEALIFHGGDQSVSVESAGGGKTSTETTAPK